MGKLFGKSPAMDYLGLVDTYAILSVDFACAAAYWHDENQKYDESSKNAQQEAGMRMDVLENYKKQLDNR